ncbi:MAG TPA: glycerol-3-phosphate 1-O-acyltransferase PlsY [Acidobacteriaceae bacterium]|nr:glycerol-3-phosphate 1-O-acyltransferase PlsY [Acidobacteriaceae bacterium]
MPFVPYALAALTAYLFGSIPFGYLLVRLVRKEDIREKGSGNIGATNVIRSGSKGLGALTFLLDALKGLFAVTLCGLVAGRAGLVPEVRANVVALAAFCAILGHIYTVWLGFRGGKGVATAFGVFLALAPWAALAALGVFVLIFAASRYVSLGSILSAAAFPAFALWIPDALRIPRTPWATAVLFLAPLIVILKHHQNIARLVSGKEYRFGAGRANDTGTSRV